MARVGEGAPRRQRDSRRPVRRRCSELYHVARRKRERRLVRGWVRAIVAYGQVADTRHGEAGERLWVARGLQCALLGRQMALVGIWEATTPCRRSSEFSRRWRLWWADWCRQSSCSESRGGMISMHGLN